MSRLPQICFAQFQMEFNFLYTDNCNVVLACISAYLFLHFAFDATHYHSVVTMLTRLKSDARSTSVDTRSFLTLCPYLHGFHNKEHP